MKSSLPPFSNIINKVVRTNPQFYQLHIGLCWGKESPFSVLNAKIELTRIQISLVKCQLLKTELNWK